MTPRKHKGWHFKFVWNPVEWSRPGYHKLMFNDKLFAVAWTFFPFEWLFFIDDFEEA